MPRQTTLQGLRKDHGLTQMDMAKLIGLSETSYRLRELGNADFKLEEMVIISKVFKKGIEEIFICN